MKGISLVFSLAGHISPSEEGVSYCPAHKDSNYILGILPNAPEMFKSSVRFCGEYVGDPAFPPFSAQIEEAASYS